MTTTNFGSPSPTPNDELHVVIIGAGPAGLTAAYCLSERDVVSTILESDDVVGGISRTVVRDGWRFDIGGHRFFTKVKPVDDLWFEILGEENFLRRPRMSRIFYNGKLYDYPLVPMNALRNLGVVEAVLCVISYGWARVRPPADQTNFEGFTAARFGWRLYRTFFKTYTEKVWGVPATDLQADWGAQRIKNLSLFRAVWEGFKPKKLRSRQDKAKQVTSLIEEFNYPKYGPGMMWERCTEIVGERGCTVAMQTTVTKIRHADGRAVSVTAVSADGGEVVYDCTHVVSSMPMGALLRAMDPPVPPEVLAAADDLRYRDFMTVALVVPESAGFPDNWIYVHDPGVRVGRVQNFGSWSPFLVKEGRTCLGLEFFVNEGDDLWTKSDGELVEQGKQELGQLGLVDPAQVEAGYVVRVPKAYPVYDATYKANVDVLREWIAQHCPNVFPVGRNGMHKYNNQDHSMYTAMLSVENILGADHDVWTVNVEDEYHEEEVPSSERGTGRDAPLLPRPDSDEGRFLAALRTVADVEGWMTDDQARLLWNRAGELRPGNTAVEIGSFRGRSTTILALAAPEGAEVVAIDPHAGSDRGPQELAANAVNGAADHDAFLANLAAASVADRVRYVREFSSDAHDAVAGEIDLLYIDGAHRYGPAQADIASWGARVRPGGTMLVHDAFSSVGVTLAQMRTLFFGAQFRYVGRAQSMVEYRRERVRGMGRGKNAARQAASLPWFVRNVLVKVFLVTKLTPLARLLGHRGDVFPY